MRAYEGSWEEAALRRLEIVYRDTVIESLLHTGRDVGVREIKRAKQKNKTSSVAKRA